MVIVRRLAPLVGAVLLAAVLPASVLATDPPPMGTIVINDGAEATNDPVVSVQLPYPTDSTGLVRLSNDGSAWSDPSPWQETIEWDVTDASAGGQPSDGQKTIFVQYDGSGTWTAAANGSIFLDRMPPSVDSMGDFLCGYSGGWVAGVCWPGWDDNSGIGRREFSLGGGLWTSTDEVTGGFDFRTLLWGGGWKSEDREVCVRVIDAAGNVSDPSCATFDLSIPSTSTKGTSTLYDVRFEFPLPAVTGKPFTIRPIYPANFPAMPSTGICEWLLRWGDEGKLRDFPNENFGSIWLRHQYGKGGCREWTFTLPYTPGLTYQFEFVIDPNWRQTGVWGTYEGPTDNINVSTFKATVGTFERGIPNSSLGLAYLLPKQFVTQPGDPVTYTLHASNTPGWTLPKPAWFWAANHECGVSIGDDKPTSATTFTYTPTCQGPWHTGWTWEKSDTNEYLRAEFDPPADKAAPKVTAPVAVPVTGSALTSTIPTRVTWTATDPMVKKVSTGVVRTKLQVSRNGRAWKNVTLPSPSATSVVVNLQPTGKYRYRIRAFDKAGNRSAWVAGPVLKPRLLQEASASLSPGWSSVKRSTLSGGIAATSSTTSSRATLSFYGRAISWVGSVGQKAGLAQVYVDGVLAQTVNLHAASAVDKRVLFARQWSGLGNHTLRIVVLGTNGRPAVAVDAFAVFK